MDSRSIALGIIALCAAGSFITYVVVNAMVRLREQKAQLLTPDIEARLARIESAVESIAIEVERNGELQRFSAGLAQGVASAELRQIARPVTPH